MHELFQEIADVERISARVALGSAKPRDLQLLGRTLALLPKIQATLDSVPAPLLKKLATQMLPQPDLEQLLLSALVDNPPQSVRDGGVIAQGFDEELDQLRQLSENATDLVLNLEQAEKEKAGLSSLKFGFNRVHGYYIELSKGQAALAPDYFQRKQTLKNVERFITPDLKRFEEQVLSAESRALAREKWLYEGLLETLKQQLDLLHQLALGLSEMDVLSTLAILAEERHWSCPSWSNTPGIEIIAGRHPVVEDHLRDGFIPNDCELYPNHNLILLTGPNMGGKSTYMRQTALIVLLAHIGSFVPAAKAHIGPIDKILSRIGASDDLAGGRSTFMVEMTETAYILAEATDKSLVLIDEIGRGTSTFDGMALAHACCAYLAEKLRAFCLFSTHYFELTRLPERYPQIRNCHLAASLSESKIVFLYKVEAGATHRSYGLEVAALAGIPEAVLEMARAQLSQHQPVENPS